MNSNISFPSAIKTEFYSSLIYREFKYSEDLILVGGQPDDSPVYESSELGIACVIFDGRINVHVTDIKSGVNIMHDQPMRGNFDGQANLIACVSMALTKMSHSSVN
jgi:hypothetical protein